MLSRLVRTTLSRPRLSLRGGAVKLRSLAPLVAASQRSFLTWSTSHSLLDNWTSNETLKAWVLDRIQLMNVGGLFLGVFLCCILRGTLCPRFALFFRAEECIVLLVECLVDTRYLVSLCSALGGRWNW